MENQTNTTEEIVWNSVYLSLKHIKKKQVSGLKDVGKEQTQPIICRNAPHLFPFPSPELQN